jgi:phenylalanyl-tRNA synthetase beta chain
MPGIIKNVVTNKTEAEMLRFFEYGRTWQLGQELKERRILAGIFYNQKDTVDFYASKALLTRLFDTLDLAVIWQKQEEQAYPWLAPYQTADLMHNGVKIGYAGKAHCSLLKRLAEGDAFMFEIDGDFLLSYKPQLKRFVPSPKYPGVHRDVSIIVPSKATVDELIDALKRVSDKVVSVSLVDFFIKDDWFDKRSLTFRIEFQDPEKTMTSEQVDTIWVRVTQTLTSLGAEIR